MPTGKPKQPDNEKITINLGYVDLGQIDLLVSEGFYANRSDFIRTAIRNQLDRQQDAVRQSIVRRQLDLGMRIITRADLEGCRSRNERLDIKVVGLATITSDVTPDLAAATIASLEVLGALQASSEVRAALRDRIR
ncbi:CopG family transcriptional regulator [Asticcacaulis sp. 201]|uniref:CopG family transcriptional regulator n=1 Tax=Asticcacaulis sp. 201 TaxID=3028787 RepID=UPI002916A989|nr:CopG family transcriptional regulator [Asticcacaulis sp. 201]MDV6330854.1 CopG family transcriptional regulator [Asticcacaulis sp. 201]